MSPTLCVQHLHKSYGDHVVVDDVSFEACPGRVLGLLGPNGAGKTTTLECVEGLRRPDGGRIRILDMDPVRDAARLRAEIGVQLQLSALPANMTPAEAMVVFARYHRVDPRPDLVERFGLGPSRDVIYRELSVGQQRRLNLALAIAHRPRLLFLDEPTAGLDVATRAELHAIVRELRADGVTVVLATHDMAEAETLADQLVILLHGRVVLTGTPREVTAAGPQLTRIAVVTAGGTVRRAASWALPAVESIDATGDATVLLSHDAGATLAAMLQHLAQADDALTDLRVERPTLEERFLQITGAQP